MSVNLPRLPEPGETIAGKYLLLRMLGRGGVGVVHEASTSSFVNVSLSRCSPRRYPLIR